MKSFLTILFLFVYVGCSLSTDPEGAIADSNESDNGDSTVSDLNRDQLMKVDLDFPITYGTEDSIVREVPFSIDEDNGLFSFDPVYIFRDPRFVWFSIAIWRYSYNGTVPLSYVGLQDVRVYDSTGRVIDTIDSAYSEGRNFILSSGPSNHGVLPDDRGYVSVHLDVAYDEPDRIAARTVSYTVAPDLKVSAAVFEPTGRFVSRGNDFSTEFVNSGTHALKIEQGFFSILFGQDGRPMGHILLLPVDHTVMPSDTSWLQGTNVMFDGTAYSIVQTPEYYAVGEAVSLDASSISEEELRYREYREEKLAQYLEYRQAALAER
jgi:hypothetical protein